MKKNYKGWFIPETAIKSAGIIGPILIGTECIELYRRRKFISEPLWPTCRPQKFPDPPPKETHIKLIYLGDTDGTAPEDVDVENDDTLTGRLQKDLLPLGGGRGRDFMEIIFPA